MLKRLVFFISILLISTSAWSWSATVVGVTDGDTITVLRNGHEQYKIRLYGIDAPELSQPFGRASKTNLSTLIFNKNVDVRPTDTDKYGRVVAHIFLDGASINSEQISRGFAWIYKRYCDKYIYTKWLPLESHARAFKSGLWSDKTPIAPWEWRSREKQFKKTIISKPNIVLSDNFNFHGNAASKIFHSHTCKYYNCKKCIIIFKSRQEAIEKGFKPCQICNP